MHKIKEQLLGSVPKRPISCRTQEWNAIRPCLHMCVHPPLETWGLNSAYWGLKFGSWVLSLKSTFLCLKSALTRLKSTFKGQKNLELQHLGHQRRVTVKGAVKEAGFHCRLFFLHGRQNKFWMQETYTSQVIKIYKLQASNEFTGITVLQTAWRQWWNKPIRHLGRSSEMVKYCIGKNDHHENWNQLGNCTAPKLIRQLQTDFFQTGPVWCLQL